ncbi:TrkH family potassium uptake protein [Frisingicoccus sp.]|uniref:TrkH family potassium uptake protein n=1 Tax=Frisingicoccus sp. TaxID=1918627 RepID=UPI003AB4698E
MREKKKSFELRTTQVIALGFVILILTGSVLLSLPFASTDGRATPYIDALFTATTSSCVTGLVTVVTGQHWSLFGQAVILVMIQLGGLGVVSFTTLLLMIAGKRIQLKQRMLIQEAYGFDTLTGMVRMVRKMIWGTLIVEAVGAVLYMFVYIPRYGLAKGIWVAVFTAVSAFCNAGMDLMGADSMMAYVSHPLMNLVTMALIVIGGLGFFVWWDLLAAARRVFRQKMSLRQSVRRMSLHSKLVLCVTAALIFGGGVVFFILEHNNPATMGDLTLGGKIWASIFQSVTLRTAGFASIDQGGLRTGSLLLGCVLMFIGGSPGGTAGGVKTVTVTLLACAVLAIVNGHEDVELGHRRVKMENVMKGICVILLQVFFLVISTFALCCIESDIPFIQIMYETFSALGTVGLTMGITEGLSVAGRLVLIASMYFGRLGPITMAMIMNVNGNKKKIHRRLPDGKVFI